MKDNRGVTLVEVIVVIAIIAIMAAGAAFSSGMIYNWQLNSGAKSFEMIYGKSRLQSMVKADVGGMVIYKQDGAITFGIANKDDMNSSSFNLFTNEVSINSKIAIAITLEEVGGTGSITEYILSAPGSIKPISPAVIDGELNLAAIKFRKGTGTELPIKYTTSNGSGVSSEYLITKVVLKLNGKSVSYMIEPATGTFTKE